MRVERRPIGLAVANLALFLAAAASFLFDTSSPSPPPSVRAIPAEDPSPKADDQPAVGEQRSAPRPVDATVESTADASPASAEAPDSAEAAEAAEALEWAGPAAATPPAEPEPEAEAEPAGIVRKSSGPQSQPLRNVAPAAAELVASIPNPISVAVIDLRRGLTFMLDANAYYDLASLAKVPLMLTLLALMDSEERSASESEQTLLELMIQWSDNKAAEALWDRVGGDRERTLLEALHVWPRVLFVRDGWGGLEGSAYGVALLFREIVAGEALSAAVRSEAMDLIDGVTFGQRWGLSAGLAEDRGATVGLKNGWYPTESGWLVHSAGYVLDTTGRPQYVLAILSADHATLEAGIETVEAIATELHASLRPGDAAARELSTIR